MPELFEPTDAERQEVTTMTIGGLTQMQIAECMRDGIDVKTLRKHFREELDIAKAKAIANLGASCYKRAMAGDNASTFFYLKTQGGWKETHP
jgi:hypothetical protein